jgi:hypothetical protein
MKKGHTLRAFVVLVSCAASLTSCKHAEQREAGAPAVQAKTSPSLDFAKFESQKRKPASAKNLQNGKSWQNYFQFVFEKKPEAKIAAAANLKIYSEEAERLANAVDKRDSDEARKSIRKFQAFLSNQSTEMPSGFYQALAAELNQADRTSSALDFKNRKITDAKYAVLLAKTKTLRASLKTFHFLNTF